MPRSRPILVTQSIFTTLGIFFGASLLADIIDPKIVGLGALIVAAVQGGITFYLSGTTTPTAQVVATQEQPGAPVVAGPASSFTTGAAIEPSVPVGEIAVPPQR